MNVKKQLLTFIDLFAGIGGFRIGFEQAEYKCVYSCEINLACQEVYLNNFGERPKSDITKINIDEIPDFDVLTAGFPCQPFSICGKRQGFEDTRGTLFFYICEIIEAKKPDVENPYKWRGLNLLGFALMEVRNILIDGENNYNP